MIINKHTGKSITRLTAFCGSGLGRDPIYEQVADRVGCCMVASGVDLTYGGGSLGLMGVISRSVVRNGGQVKGFIPLHLVEREKPEPVPGVEIRYTKDFHERKMEFFNNSDGYLCLPGGCGTLEEAVEQLTWTQVGVSDKPIIFINTKGFWDPLFYLFDHMREELFIRPGLTINPLIADFADEVMPILAGDMPSRVPCNGKGAGNPFHPDQMTMFDETALPPHLAAAHLARMDVSTAARN